MNGVTQEANANCYKKAGFKKQLSKSQGESGTKAAQDKDLDNIYEHLANLQYISANNSNLLNDFTAVYENLVTSPILRNCDVAKEVRDARQIAANEVDEDDGDEDNFDDIVLLPLSSDAAAAVQVLQRFFEVLDLPNAEGTVILLSKIDAAINNIWMKNTVQKCDLVLLQDI